MSAGTTKADEAKSAEELEREISAEREDLKQTVEALKEQISIGGAIDRITNAFRDFGQSSEGGSVLRTVQRTAQENPLPLALVGAGVALMLAGGGPSTRRLTDGAREGTERARLAAERGRERLTGDDDHETDATGYDPAFARRPRERYDPAFASSDGASYDDLYDDEILGEDPFIVGRSSHDGRPRDALTGEPIGVPVGSQSLDDEGHSRRETIRRRFAETGEQLSTEMRERREKARDKARQAAEEARLRADEARRVLRERGQRGMQRMRGGADRAGREAQGFFYDNPLASGAIALAIGALAGSALPQTDAENRAVGDRASGVRADLVDRVIAEARRARRVAEAATREAMEAFGDEAHAGMDGAGGGRGAVQAAEGKVAGAGDRVAKAAEIEADRQDLGASARRTG